jgi:hypothetical protein
MPASTRTDRKIGGRKGARNFIVLSRPHFFAFFVPHFSVEISSPQPWLHGTVQLEVHGRLGEIGITLPSNWTFANWLIRAIKQCLWAIQTGYSCWRVIVRLDSPLRWDDHLTVPRVGCLARFAASDVKLTGGAADRRIFRGPKALDALVIASGILASVSVVWFLLCASFSKFAKVQF